MVKVTIKASVQVTDGQAAFFSSDFDPGTSVYSTLEIAKGQKTSALLLPARSTPVLLAISATQADGKPAILQVVPIDDAGKQGAAFTVSGSLLVTNQAILDMLIKDGPKALELTNSSPETASIKIIAASASPPPPPPPGNGGGGGGNGGGGVNP